MRERKSAIFLVLHTESPRINLMLQKLTSQSDNPATDYPEKSFRNAISKMAILAQCGVC